MKHAPSKALPEFDLTGKYVVTRGFPWALAMTRLQSQRPRVPVDLSGMKARFEIHDTQHRHRAPWVFSTDSGHIVLGAAGTVDIRLADTDTESIRATACRYRLIFADSLSNESVLLRGRLAVLEGEK
jgi:hypothetical protein